MTRQAGDNEAGTGGVRAVERAIDVLNCFAGNSNGLKVAQIEQQTGIARPTLYRLLKTLEGRNLVRQSSDPTRYELDYGTAELAYTWLRGVNLPTKAAPLLENLAIAAGETVALCVVRDGKRVYIHEIASDNPLTLMRGVGSTEALTNGAGGIAILAAYPDDVVRSLLTELPMRERKKKSAEIDSTRERGYAISEGAYIAGASAIAVSFLDRFDRVHGSVSVSGPSSRLTPDRYDEIADLITATTRKISSLVV